MGRRTVIYGFVGTRLDAGMQDKRWNRWRPTVSLGQQADLEVARLELWVTGRAGQLAEQIRRDFLEVSPHSEVTLHRLPIRDAWEFDEVYGALHDFARQTPFDLEGEDYLVHITTGTHVEQICLFLLTESRHFPARLLQTSPLNHRRGDPRGSDPRGTFRVIDLDLERYDRLAARFQSEHTEGRDLLKSGIATRNPSYNQLIDRIETVALRSRAPILLQGETGTGKTQLARRIYELKRRRALLEGELVELNCATLRGDQAMSTLFGHVRGAFTGAEQERAGLLKRADRGLLFLDEIGELGLDEQAMLLRALEEQSFLPVGSDATVQSQFQLIAGTNRNLRQRVQTGRFRQDLLARIHLWTFELPSLAQRREDIEPNLDYELQGFTSQTGDMLSMSREARQRFLEFALSEQASWQGNFRDLNASITRMGTLATGNRIRREQVDEEIGRLQSQWQAESRIEPPSQSTAGALRQWVPEEVVARVDPFDRVQLLYVIQTCRGSASLSAAGRRLFAASRQRKATPNDADRLRKYLARYGLSWETIRAGGRDDTGGA